MNRNFELNRLRRRCKIVCAILFALFAVTIAGNAQQTGKPKPAPSQTPVAAPSPGKTDGAVSSQDAPPDSSQTRQKPLPQFNVLRDEEDWTVFADENLRQDALDKLKYIRLRKNRDDWFLSIGGEVREWFEHFDNEVWGAIPGGNNYLLQRYMLHGDFHFGKRVRAFVQLKSGLEAYRRTGSRLVDEDKLDVNQAFVDFNFGGHPIPKDAPPSYGNASGDNNKPLVILRLGRQELNFGTGRLISAREGVNVRAGFDGGRVIFQPNQWRIDAFLVKPVDTKTGYFDDNYLHDQTLWGVYATRPFAPIKFSTVDFYYIGSDRKIGIFNQGAGRDARQTIGVRLSNNIPIKAFNYDLETTYQFGKFKRFGANGIQNGNINAWAISTFVGYRFLKTKFQPQFTFAGGAASGDKNPRTANLQSFFSLYPRGDYFGKSAQLGPINVIGGQPRFNLNLTKTVALTLSSNFFWRESLNDGLYIPAGFPVRFSYTSRARYIGSQPEAEIFWQANRRLSFDVNFSRFFTGKYLRESPPGRNLNYLAAYATYKF